MRPVFPGVVPATQAPKGVVGINFEELASALEVMANPNRLRLLHQLLQPKSAAEISLPPETVRQGENPDRRISRQGVQLHLEKLASIGIISTAREPRGKSLVEVHALHYPRLFALVEEFRALGRLRPERQLGDPQTIPAAGLPAPAATEGPHVVIVHGLHEGTAFALTDDNRSSPGRWVLGRKRGLPVCLDYDPYVSAENSEFLRHSEGEIAVRALSSGRNGTSVNWQMLQAEEAQVLRHGDVIGVGRTLLLFRQP